MGKWYYGKKHGEGLAIDKDGTPTVEVLALSSFPVSLLDSLSSSHATHTFTPPHSI
jgi:hypothetical protein